MTVNQPPPAHPDWCTLDHLPPSPTCYAAIYDVSPCDGTERLGFEIHVPGNGYDDDTPHELHLGDGSRLRWRGFEAWSLQGMAAIIMAASDRLYDMEREVDALEELFQEANPNDSHDDPTTDRDN